MCSSDLSAVLEACSGLDQPAPAGYVAWALSCGAEVEERMVLRAAKASNDRGDNAGALVYIGSVADEHRSQEMVCEEVRSLIALGENQNALEVLHRFAPRLEKEQRRSWVELMVRKAALLRSLPKEGDAQCVLDDLLGEGGWNPQALGPGQFAPGTDAAIVLAQADLWLAEGNYAQSVDPLLFLAGKEDLAPGTRALAATMAAEALCVTGRAGEGMDLLKGAWPLILEPRAAADQTAVLSHVFYACFAAGELNRALDLLGSLDDNEEGAYRGSAGELAGGFIRAAAGEGDAALEFLLPAVGQLRY